MSMRARRLWMTRLFHLAGRAERMSGGRAESGALCEGLEARTLLAAFTVTNLNDSGAGSLRAAIAAAEAADGEDSITFQGVNGTIALASGLAITTSMTIDATGITLTGGNGTGLLAVNSGTVAITGGTFSGGTNTGAGGGIVNGGTLTLQRVMVNGNSSGVAGGGIANFGTLTISDSRISGNVATGGGFAGGIFNAQGTTLTIERSEISGNNGNGFSGAIDARGTVTIRNSTITGNIANDTGGILIGGSGSATVTIQNSTIATNSSTFGGGIDIRNPGSQVVISSTIVSGNTQNGGPRDIHAGTLAAGSTHNLIGDAGSAGGLTGGVNNNLVGGNVFLGTLSGTGIARFIPILPGSFAIGAGTANGLTTDQRGAGFARATNGQVDIGAFQVQESAVLVDLTTDENDGNFASGDMSLREAVLQSASLVRVRITFAWGTTATSVAVNAGPIQVNFAENVSIDGVGATTIAGNNTSRIFRVNGAGSLSLTGVTITGGTTGSGSAGGAILNEPGGTLALTRTTITGNTATDDSGGGIANRGTLTMIDSTISNNTATFGGGGLHNTGAATITRSTISGNTANNQSGPGGGGGIANTSGGTITIIGSTIANNTSSFGFGGALFTNGAGAASISNSTIAGNVATGSFGFALSRNGTGTLVLISSIVSASQLVIFGTISAGSTNNIVIGGNAPDSLGQLTNGVNGNLVGVNPLLGPLANNGGATQTMALLAGSPAINVGVNPNALATDQRGTGFERVVGSAIDIGAYEYVPPPVAPTLVSLTASLGSVAAGSTVTLTANGAADSDASIARVDFYLDANGNGVGETGELFATDTNGADGYTAVYGATQGQATTAGARAFLAIAVDTQTLSSPTRGASVTWTAQAASAVVTVSTDETNGNLNANDLSLREVLQLINAGTVQGPVTFASGVTQITLASALPTITRGVTITGPGAGSLTISGANQFQIFSVNDGAPAALTVTISGMTLTQGSSAAGGAISNFESLTVDGVVFLNNRAVANGMGSGGAIDDNGTLTVRNSRFAGNTSDGFGSAINFANGAGAGTVSGSAFLGNSAPTGSTIDSNPGHTLTIDTSTFANNTGFVGGAVFMGLFLTVRQSTFFGNISASFGGAIAMYGGTLVVENSTIVGNRADSGGTGTGQGGGIEVGKNDAPGATDPGTLRLVSTILSGNVRGTGTGTPDELAFSRGARVTTDSTNNLIRDGASAGGLVNGVNGNIIGVDPLLATTLTTEGTALGGVLALLAGSPAINAGLNPNNATTDQRGTGFTRVVGSAIDIGAYEAPASVPGSGGTPTGQTGPTQYQARSTAIEQVEAGASGLTVVTTTNSSGQPVVFRQNAQGQWVVTNVGSRLSVATLSGDPTPFVGPDGRNYAMARSGTSMLLFTESGGAWTLRNLTTELRVPTALAPTDLTSFVDRSNNRYLAGRADNGNVVMFVGTRSGNNYNWTFTNLSDQLTAQGLVTPAFTSRLVSYTTSWNGLNIAGLDAQGVIHTVWWAPSLTRWTTSNLSAITGAPAYSGQLTTYVTSYDATNLIGTSADGQVIATWWLPGIQWRADNLTTLFNGPRMTAASVSSYVTGWDGTNIAGIDSNGQIQVYWWAPGMNTWQIFNMTTGITNATPMVGSVRGFTSGPGILNLVGAASNGDVLRYSVNPFAPNAVWGQENLTTIATPG